MPRDGKSGGVIVYPLVHFFLGYTPTTGCAFLLGPSAGKRGSFYYQSAALVLASSRNLGHSPTKRLGDLKYMLSL